MTQDTVLASRGNASRLTTEDLDLPSTAEIIGLQFTATSRRDYKLVAPYLTYGLTAWGQAYKSHLEKLLKLQKRALRFIYFSERNQHAIPLFIDAGVLPLKFLYYEHLANLMFEIRHSNAPGNIQDIFQDISDIHSYNT